MQDQIINKTYLNTAACGLLSPQSIQVSTDFYNALLTNGSTRSEQWRANELDSIRDTVATFINAPAANIALLPNFSFGLNSIVHALRGDEKILLYKNDFPSVLEPFKINNFDITWLDAEDGFFISPDEIKAALICSKIDMLVISHVQWNSGYKLDINDIGSFCKEHGIIFIVDATQSLGAIAIDMQTLHADVVIASSYKWMNAGFGTAVMYMADSFLAKYIPVIGGFGSYVMKDGAFIYDRASVRSYEPGHPNINGLLLLQAAIREKLAKGIDSIENHNSVLIQYLLAEMSNFPVNLIGNKDTTHRSPIVLVHDENGLGKHIASQDIVVTQRGGLLRMSVHFYNTKAHVDIFINSLRSFYIQ